VAVWLSAPNPLFSAGCQKRLDGPLQPSVPFCRAFSAASSLEARSADFFSAAASCRFSRVSESLRNHKLRIAPSLFLLHLPSHLSRWLRYQSDWRCCWAADSPSSEKWVSRDSGAELRVVTDAAASSSEMASRRFGTPRCSRFLVNSPSFSEVFGRNSRIIGQISKKKIM